MSEWPRVLLAAAQFGLLVVPLASARAQHDDRAQLRRSYEVLTSRQVLLAERRDSLVKATRRALTQEFTAGSRRVRYREGDLSPEDSARIASALAAVEQELRVTFGATTPALLDSADWEYVPNLSRMRRGFASLRFVAPGGSGRHLSIRGAVNTAEIRTAALSLAGAQAGTLHPELRAFAPVIGALAVSPPQLERASRSLALAGSSYGRDCLKEALAACRRVLEPPPSLGLVDQFFTADDFAGLARAGTRPRIATDTAWYTQRARCVETGDRESCEHAARGRRLQDPFRGEMRGTLLIEALLTGGEAGLRRLLAAGDRFRDDPIGLLAHVSGLPAEELLGRWQSRLVESLTLSRTPVVPDVLATFAWCGLLFLAATVRRSA
jgi:hypothetical protein